MNAVTDGATRVVSNPETEGWNRADNFRVARHLDTMRSSQGIERIFAETPELNFAFEGEQMYDSRPKSSQGIERIFAETPELNFAFEGEQMYDSRPKARARKWLSRLLPAKSYAIA